MGNIFASAAKDALKKKAGAVKNKAKAAKSKVANVFRRKKAPYEEPEEFSNWAIAMSPAAYEAVVARPRLAARRTSPYEEPEEYESEGEDYEDEDYESDAEEYSALHQQYTPADFVNMATPMNFTIVLMILLFVLLILARR